MKKNNINYLLLAFVLLFSIIAKGQDNNMFYHMENMPQAYDLNPANLHDGSKIIFSLPGLTRYNVGINSTFSIDKVASKQGNDLLIDLDKFYNNIPDQNFLSQSFSMPLLNFQLRTNDQVFSFSVNERELLRMGFEKNLIGFLNSGNAAYVGSTFSTNLDMNMLHYREYNLGYTRKVIDNLTAGIRIKLLTGFAAVNTGVSKFSITTDSNMEYIEIATEGDYNISIPMVAPQTNGNLFDVVSTEGELDPIGYALNFSNMGVGIDLGVNYQLTPEIELSASVLDLGTIGWKSNLTHLTHGGSFKWEGLDFSNSIDENDPNYVPFDEQITKLEEDITNSLNMKATADEFSTTLPTRIYVGGQYKVNEMFTAGLVDQLMLYDGILTNAVTLSGNALFLNAISVSASYSIIGNSYTNLGLGAAFKAGPVQFFIATDNLLAITSPLSAQHMNASFGFNFMLGQK
ncbi:DUF5723 family protein [Roseimarinus sediminis]|uniref:DUF5723 family protein n=1 Tax=Roseimarinus sediminis TaxID=1610899 RepID=UPI003D245AD3